jgi:hypothetical protein
VSANELPVPAHQVAGVTGKVAQRSRGRSHASGASTARSVGENLGRATWRFSTEN